MMCREVERLLPEYSAEALSRQQTERVRAHLEGCAACAGEWAKLGSALRLVEQFGAVEPPPGLWDVVYRQIQAEAREGQPAGRARSWWAGIFMPLAGARMAQAGLAAAALVAALWGFWPGESERVPERMTVQIPVLAQEPEMVAAMQQHSLASAGLFFGDRAGLESVVQIVRRHEEVP